jgi:phosphoenolpyruvate carboxylase
MPYSNTAALRDRLKDLHKLTEQTPLFNPVFQLGLDLSREIEGERLSLEDVSGLISALECESLQSRSRQLHKKLAPVTLNKNTARFQEILGQSSDYKAFEQRWTKPLLHAVFTAHPTFLLNQDQSDAVANAASQGEFSEETVCAVSAAREAITLDIEHNQAMAAIANAQDARDLLVSEILKTAATKWKEDWQSLKPMPFRFATWVGYDMDGRTDISWATSIRYRLHEKAQRLSRYAEALAKVDASIDQVSVLQAAAQHSAALAEVFAKDVSTPQAVSHAANLLTADHPHKMISLGPVIDALEALAKQSQQDKAIALMTTIAAMRADGLGMGWVHFRVNSSQLHNAIRRRIDPDNTLDLNSRSALQRIRSLIEKTTPLRSNFAALDIENTTAVRQFLVMAQILNHIDQDTPIRMLIAECEEPQTVLSALYFAKLFGIADRVDVSPLFETESAMEHGARFLDAMIGEPAYQDYARKRGRISIQTGFSDAGRFVGQLPAALAIERLHGRLAKMMTRHGMRDVAALIFNTHGESMGRGAHPGSMHDRMRYPLSQWARLQFKKAEIQIEPEVSFQGGDGYLNFKTPALALATLTRICEAELTPLSSEDDPFYTRTDISLDFYRGIRRVQREHLESRTYARAITAFGLGLLNETGSRKSRRQSDLAADREMSLRQIRAIPHNAILQQLGYPVNVIAGVGTASGEDIEAIADMLNASERGRIMLGMLRASNRLASIKSVAAYGELFNSAYWASRPYRGTETHLEPACLALAEKLTSDDRTGVFRRLASRLRVDGLKLHRLLARLNEEPSAEDAAVNNREDLRRSLGVLHGLRLALLQHMFILAAQIPAFSRSNDISRDDVLEMIFSLRIEDALAQLRRAFPVTSPSMDAYSVNDPSDYPDGDQQAYAGIQAQYINPIEHAYALCLRIGTTIANHFGAHG